MMNLLQVQDDLKNFSQDQLVKEMQQPSGSTPQFLVLSELNRRKRVKGDFEARQAQNQPTVAEEAVASAGVPQSGMMGMPEAMAPQSAVSEGVGTSAPMKMASGGLAQFGNEIRQGMGQEIDPYLDGVQQEAESKFNVDLNNNMEKVQPGGMESTRPAILRNPFELTNGMDQLRPYRGSPPQIGFGGKGMARPEPAYATNMEARMPRGLGAINAFGARGFAEGGVVRAADGLPEEESKFGDGLINYIGNMFSFGDDNDSKGQFGEGPQPDEIPEINTKGIDQAINDAPPAKIPEKQPEQKLNLTSAEPEALSIEQELLKRQAGLDKDRNFDKYMALAQAGLGILASDKPTLAGAIGEGGMSGLDAFREANKRYEEGLNDILNARSKIQQAKIAAGSKGKLTRSSALSAITSYNNSITSIRKEIGKLSELAGAPGVDDQVKQLQKQIVELETEKSQLYDSAKIRPRSSINVGKLPSTQKAS